MGRGIVGKHVVARLHERLDPARKLRRAPPPAVSKNNCRPSARPLVAGDGLVRSQHLGVALRWEAFKRYRGEGERKTPRLNGKRWGRKAGRGKPEGYKLRKRHTAILSLTSLCDAAITVGAGLGILGEVHENLLPLDNRAW